ncbi:MAG: hypothetical protein ABH804_01440 [archaeon]
MAEKDTIFSSKIKSDGFFDFRGFYEFCYKWLTEETGLDITEKKYTEKLKGDSKDIELEWGGDKKITDYFKFEVKVEMMIRNMVNVEIKQGDKKIATNKGTAEVKMKGVLVRDYQGKFEKSGFLKFLRAIYEKWIIKSRTEEFEEKVFGDCDEFLGQAKAWLDLEGKR